MSSEGYVMNPVMPRSSACEPSSIDSAGKTRLQCAIEERRASSWLNHSAAEDFVNNLKVEDLDTEHHTSAMDIISNNPVLKSFIAGSLSGTFSTVMFQPLDLVKTRLQNTVPAAVGHRSSSMITIMVHILRKEHLAGLWKGMTPSITRCVPGVGLYFSSLHWLKSHLVQGDPGPMQAVALGMMARTLSGVLLIPITVVKTRFESGVYQYGGVTEALRVIYRTEGARGLCCGLLPTLIRDAPFSGIYLMFYTQAKKTVPQEWLQQTSAGGNSFTHFGCGVIAGVMASVVTQPADVLKTKMQLYPHKFSSVLSVVMYVQKTYGFRGYFKGLAPRMLRRTLMAAMAWTVYEQITRQIGLK
ncbi:mitochondrial glycine transporter A-like isoform X1 [Schistocerca americana]|uniref:mitochondrial glycine transporter A-like isoform X1 n=2 Tax=Schistocerca americana TaxID=7009 RepID=UPI001F4F57DD|nr:mitochondrial glycine transporter A-like isoform X1 [Schistocerca americana]